MYHGMHMYDRTRQASSSYRTIILVYIREAMAGHWQRDTVRTSMLVVGSSMVPPGGVLPTILLSVSEAPRRIVRCMITGAVTPRAPSILRMYNKTS